MEIVGVVGSLEHRIAQIQRINLNPADDVGILPAHPLQIHLEQGAAHIGLGGDRRGELAGYILVGVLSLFIFQQPFYQQHRRHQRHQQQQPPDHIQRRNFFMAFRLAHLALILSSPAALRAAALYSYHTEKG